MYEKWKDGKYIVYFQVFINMYVFVEVFCEKFEFVFVFDDVVGILIVICLDCLFDDVVDYLVELNECMYLWVEFGF